MGFKPGNPGRPKGAISKYSRMVEETAGRLECDPFEILLKFAKGDWEALGYDSSVMIKESADGKSTFTDYTISPELRARCAEKACEYLYSKRKSIEHIQNNVLEGMTPEQKLEAMKQAVKHLEGEISDNRGGLSREVKDTGSK